MSKIFWLIAIAVVTLFGSRSSFAHTFDISVSVDRTTKVTVSEPCGSPCYPPTWDTVSRYGSTFYTQPSYPGSTGAACPTVCVKYQNEYGLGLLAPGNYIFQIGPAVQKFTVPEFTNRAPTISGTPAITSAPGSYSFAPSASDPDGDPLSFTIVNRPAWASFDSKTGSLTGMLSDYESGVFGNIAISATDGAATAKLPPFTLIVSGGKVVASVPAIQGDCNGDGKVSISELQSAVNMFLGIAQASGCVDESGDRTVSISEVQKAINLFLGLTGPSVELLSFQYLARTGTCANIKNRLFLIDGNSVLWDREGSCADFTYAVTLYGSTVDTVHCYSHDSIAGPVQYCPGAGYSDLFATITANLGKPDLGLGPGHTVEKITF